VRFEHLPGVIDLGVAETRFKRADCSIEFGTYIEALL
jgi:hypothetical protein